MGVPVPPVPRACPLRRFRDEAACRVVERPRHIHRVHATAGPGLAEELREGLVERAVSPAGLEKKPVIAGATSRGDRSQKSYSADPVPDSVNGFPRPRNGYAAGMRIAITGASGNIGTALLRALDRGHEVITVARRLPDRYAEPYSWAQWRALDIGEPGADQELREVFTGADAVVHLAWAISPEWSDPSMVRTNEDGTRNVLQAVTSAGVRRLVCASSVAAYAPGPPEEKVTEDWPCSGIESSAYSRSKALLETALDVFSSRHPEVALARIRPCAVLQRLAAGEFTRWLLAPLLPPGLIGGRYLPVPLWESLRAQAVHADDVAEAIRLILDRQAVGPFNLAAEDVLHASELAQALGGTRVPTTKPVVRAVAQLSWLAGLQPLHPGWLELADQAALVDTTRARTVLGWQPRYRAAEALRDLIEGLRRGDGESSAPLASARTGLLHRARALTRGRPTHQSQA
nr:NAD-dependent epimerase/dehydratase family protein [Amycolatopsis rubida]